MSDEHVMARCQPIWLETARWLEEHDRHMRRERKTRIRRQLHVALLLLIAFMAGWVTRALIWWWLF